MHTVYAQCCHAQSTDGTGMSTRTVMDTPKEDIQVTAMNDRVTKTYTYVYIYIFFASKLTAVAYVFLCTTCQLIEYIKGYILFV